MNFYDLLLAKSLNGGGGGAELEWFNVTLDSTIGETDNPIHVEAVTKDTPFSAMGTMDEIIVPSIEYVGGEKTIPVLVQTVTNNGQTMKIGLLDVFSGSRSGGTYVNIYSDLEVKSGQCQITPVGILALGNCTIGHKTIV